MSLEDQFDHAFAIAAGDGVGPADGVLEGYKARIKSIPDLSQLEKSALVSCYLRHYDGSDESRVLQDLATKTEVLLLTFQGVLVGFTTIEIYERKWNGHPIRVVYSGDTIVEREHWGQQTLAFAWIKRMGQIKRDALNVPLYWFVIIKGHRTYKFLHAFGKSFYPHWSVERADLKAIADTLAIEKFGDDYHVANSLIQFPTSHGHLKQEIALPSAEELRKESVRFFMTRNPNYLKGHEMVCLCELELHNMRPLTRRIFSRSLA